MFGNELWQWIVTTADAHEPQFLKMLNYQLYLVSGIYPYLGLARRPWLSRLEMALALGTDMGMPLCLMLFFGNAPHPLTVQRVHGLVMALLVGK